MSDRKDNDFIDNNNSEPVVPDEITVSAMSADSKVGKKQSFFASRSFRYGTLATVMTALLIIVVIAANMVFSVLTDSYSWALDLTSTGLYNISDATKQVVNSLDPATEIEITVFYEQSKYPYFLSEPLKRFCNLSDCLTYTYVDPEKNPAALTQFGNDYNIQSGAVVMKSGDRIRVFNIADYYTVDQETGSMYVYLEERLAAGILFVTEENIPVVYFLKGHGEDGYDALKNLIANNGAEVREVNLMTDAVEFTPQSNLMIVANPTRDYSDAEIRRIDDFLSNDNQFGRNLMYFSSTDAVKLPNIENFLADWGIQFADDRVLDSKYCVGTSPYLVIPEFTTEEIMNTGATVSTVTSPIVSDARSINLLFGESTMYKTQSLISSFAESSYSRDKNVLSTSWDKQSGDKSGPFTMSALSMKYKYINNVQVQSYVLASGSVGMLDVNYLTYSGNGEYLMQLYKIMINQKDDTILAAQKSSSSTIAVLTNEQTLGMTLVVLIILPVLFLIIGLVVYIRRRFL